LAVSRGSAGARFDRVAVTQITALVNLPPEAQERVLLGEGGVGIRAAIRAGREAEWA